MPDLFDELPPEQPELELEYVLDATKPLVLLLGWVDHEGILSSLKATGRQYKKKLLNSYPENWSTIVKLFDEFTISSVLGKFPGHVMSLLVEPGYTEVRDQLFKRVGKVPNQVYVYEQVLQGEQNEGILAEVDPYPPQSTRDAAIAFLRSSNIEIVPYRTKAEVTVLAEAFLEELDRNLIFRLYVPSGRLWSSEAAKFLQLFQDYIAKVDRLAVRLDQKRTDYGVIYEFHGEAPPGESDLSTEFHDFSKLMDLCAIDSEAAATLLASKSLDAREVTRILERYSKEVRRLQIDIKHEAESKVMSIRHRLESELVEFNPSIEDWKEIDSLLSRFVPSFPGALPKPSLAMGGLTHRATANGSVVTYNFRPQFINTLNGVLAEEIRGDQHFAPEHHRLLEAVREHGGLQAKQLETAIYEIADKGVDPVNKLRARQRLKAFLIAAGKKTGDIAFSVLQKYLESQIGI